MADINKNSLKGESHPKQIFKLPIEYCTTKYPIDKYICEDLELYETRDPSNLPIYNYLFNPKTSLGKECLHDWGKYYTTDLMFLKESQKIYKRLSNISIKKECCSSL